MSEYEIKFQVLHEGCLTHYLLPRYWEIVENSLPNGSWWFNDSIVGKFDYDPEVLIGIQIETIYVEENLTPAVDVNPATQTVKLTWDIGKGSDKFFVSQSKIESEGVGVKIYQREDQTLYLKSIEIPWYFFESLKGNVDVKKYQSFLSSENYELEPIIEISKNL